MDEPSAQGAGAPFGRTAGFLALWVTGRASLAASPALALN